MLDGDQRRHKELDHDSAPRRRLESAEHQAAARLGAGAINQGFDVPLVRPRGCGRTLGEEAPSAAEKMDASNHQKLYIYPVFCADAMAELNKQEEQEWVIRCSARLHARWPRICREQRDETAEELWRAGTWRDMEPEQAAAAWIDLGGPADERSG